MEGKISKLVCIYPGRFQPFSHHHFKVYQILVDRFGADNVFIAPTKTTGDGDNPLNPTEKIKNIMLYGIRESQIKLVTSPYKADEILQSFDPATTSAIFAFGEKDSDRINFSKKDGTPGWFKRYTGTHDIPFSLGGYALPISNISIAGNIYNSSEIRIKIANNCDYLEFCKLMRLEPSNDLWAVFNALRQKLCTTKLQETNMVNSKAKSKHLMHPWEDGDLSYTEILQMVKVSCTGNLQYCIEKFDGQNLLVTYNGKKILTARNKGEIKNPLSIDELRDKFANRGAVTDAFVWAAETIEMALKNCNQSLLSYFLPDTTFFLNIEILYPATKNVIDYGSKPKIVIHSVNRYSETGEELHRIPDIQPLVANINDDAILPPNPVKFDFNPEIYKQFKAEINKLWLQYNLKMNQTLNDLYEAICPELRFFNHSLKSRQELLRKEVFPVVEIPFLRAGYLMLKNSKGYHNYGKKAQFPISTIPEIDTNPELKRHINRIRRIGNINDAVPYEGVVFEYNGNLYKWTGFFAPINQILGFWKYKR